MVLEAERHGCVREVLVIAAALSIQDPRERPADERAQADAAHRRFDVDGSDLLSIVALWDYLRDRQRARSSNQFRKLCRAEYLNYLRVREWQDLFSQLRQVAGDLGIRAGSSRTTPATPTTSTSRCSPGCCRTSASATATPGSSAARAARRSSIAPGSVLAKQPPRWVMAAELVETNRLWARRVAAVQPEWAERIGAHLVKRSYSEPRWDRRGGRAIATETVTLYGLPIVTGRTVGYDRVDRAAARDLFIRHALVDGEWDAAPPLPRPQPGVRRRGRRPRGSGPTRPPPRRRRRARLLRRAPPGRRRVDAALRAVVARRLDDERPTCSS